MWTVNFQMFKLVLEKAEEPEIKLPTSTESSKKQESSRRTSISALLTMPKPLTVWVTTNCGKFWKRWDYQTTWSASWETCMQVRKQQLELNMEQQTGSKQGKEYIKAVYCHSAYLTYMQNMLCIWTVVLEKTLESPLDWKEIQPVHPKGNQCWIFIGRTDAEAEAPIHWPPYVKNWLLGKDPDVGKDWRQEEKGTTKDEMIGWHHWLNGHEFA